VLLLADCSKPPAAVEGPKPDSPAPGLEAPPLVDCAEPLAWDFAFHHSWGPGDEPWYAYDGATGVLEVRYCGLPLQVFERKLSPEETKSAFCWMHELGVLEWEEDLIMRSCQTPGAHSETRVTWSEDTRTFSWAETPCKAQPLAEQVGAVSKRLERLILAPIWPKIRRKDCALQ